MIYTSQAQYLAYHPVQLSWLQAAGLLGVGVTGYAIFRSANNEKFRLRRSRGRCLIWGRKPRTLHVTYQTADGSRHPSMLLCSGKPPVITGRRVILANPNTFQVGGELFAIQTTWETLFSRSALAPAVDSLIFYPGHIFSSWRHFSFIDACGMRPAAPRNTENHGEHTVRLCSGG
jgi:hypothetical protein